MSLGRFKLAALVLGWQAILPCQFDTLSAQERVPEATGATEKVVDEKVVDEAKLRPALSDAVRRIPELRGSWAKVVVQPDLPLEVVLVVDADPAVGARQEELLREVVKKHPVRISTTLARRKCCRWAPCS